MLGELKMVSNGSKLEKCTKFRNIVIDFDESVLDEHCCYKNFSNKSDEKKSRV